jgi:hypothetical protein
MLKALLYPNMPIYESTYDAYPSSNISAAAQYSHTTSSQALLYHAIASARMLCSTPYKGTGYLNNMSITHLTRPETSTEAPPSCGGTSRRYGRVDSASLFIIRLPASKNDTSRPPFIAKDGCITLAPAQRNGHTVHRCAMLIPSALLYTHSNDSF